MKKKLQDTFRDRSICNTSNSTIFKSKSLKQNLRKSRNLLNNKVGMSILQRKPFKRNLRKSQIFTQRSEGGSILLPLKKTCGNLKIVLKKCNGVQCYKRNPFTFSMVFRKHIFI